MDEPNPLTAVTRVAVEFLTLWMEPDRYAAIQHIGRVLNEPGAPGALLVIGGQLNLGLSLVTMLARERGAATEDEVEAKVRQILQELSRDLPE